MSAPLFYDQGKVGDDIPLQISFTNADGTARVIESAYITIANQRGENVLNEVAASLVSASTAQYVFTPTMPSQYIVEWHLVHDGGRDKFVSDITLQVVPRQAP